MSETGEFEHELLPEPRDLFVGFKSLLIEHGMYEEGDGVAAEFDTFFLDGASLPLDVQSLIDKVEFVPEFDYRNESDGNYVGITLPPNPKGLIRTIQIFTIGEGIHMEAWDRYESEDDMESVEEALIELNLSDVQKLKRAIMQDRSPTASEIRRMGRVLTSLKQHFGM